MKKMNLVSSIVLSIALLSAQQVEAGFFSSLKKIAGSAAKKAVTVVKTVATDPNVQKKILKAGMAVAGAVVAKKAVDKAQASPTEQATEAAPATAEAQG